MGMVIGTAGRKDSTVRRNVGQREIGREKRDLEAGSRTGKRREKRDGIRVQRSADMGR